MGDFVADEMVLSMVSGGTLSLAFGMAPSSRWFPVSRRREGQNGQQRSGAASSLLSKAVDSHRRRTAEHPARRGDSQSRQHLRSQTKQNKQNRNQSEMLSNSELLPRSTKKSPSGTAAGSRPTKNIKRRNESQNENMLARGDKVDAGSKKDEEFPIGQHFCEIGRALASLGEWDEALDNWDEALRVQTEILGDNHLVVANTQVYRGTALAKLGRLYDSILELENAARIQKKATSVSTGGGTHLQTSDTLFLVGIVQQARGNYVEAIDSFESSMKLKQEISGTFHESVARTICCIGNAYHQRRQYEKAVERYREGLGLYKRAGVSRQHPHVAWISRCISDKTMLAELTRNYWADSNCI